MNRSVILSILALLGVFVLFIRQTALQDEMKKPRANGTVQVSAPPPAAPAVEVAHNMTRIQSHAEKLWWAGQAGNLELAKFYRHEVKEEMEDIANAGIVTSGIPISENMKVYGIRAIDALKEQLATEGLKDFPARYESLVNTCNSCHAVSGHPELRMRIPQENRFTGQDFSIKP
jgi:hypothetical protein